MSFLSIVIILFLIMDPVGSVSTFIRILEDIAPSRRVWVIVREMLFALITMFIFYFIGDILLDALKLSETAVYISSGIVLFIAAVKILFPSMGNIRDFLESNGEPFVVPLAIPLIAGPSLLATIMLFAHLDSISSLVLPALFIAWLCAMIILAFSQSLHKLLGENGLVALERVMGMVLVLLAIQRLLEGIRLFITSYPIHQ